MIFTIFYMYSTVMQWWRLGTLKNKLRGTLNGKNALLVLAGDNTITEPDHQRSLESLLFHNEDRIACTIVPRQVINLNQWLRFPYDYTQFPIHLTSSKLILATPKIFVMLRTNLEHYYPHEAEIIEIEKFGQLYAWRVNNYFEIILKTDFENITKLVHCFSNGDIDINHELKVLKFEVVDIEGNTSKIKYDKFFSIEEKLKYSCADIHWIKFVSSLKDIYSKISEITLNPKITIENGTKPEESKKVPVSEVKPIKKDTKRKDTEALEDKKDTLEVHQKKPKDLKGKTREYRTARAQQQHKTAVKEEAKHKEEKRSQKDERHKYKNREDDKDAQKSKESRSDQKKDGKSKDKKKERDEKIFLINGQSSKARYEVDVTDAVKKDVEINKNLADDVQIEESTSKKTSRRKSEIKSKIENVDSKAIDQNASKIEKEQKESGIATKSEDTDKNLITNQENLKPAEENLASSSKSFYDKPNITNDQISEELYLKGLPRKVPVSNIIQEKNVNFSDSKKPLRKSSKSAKNAKPPNVLVYADSIVAKENVKEVLGDTLNKEKYTIYDLPTNKTSTFWDDSTSLVVVCGNVTPSLTSDLLQYLMNGGQLLCLCSDLLYTILQTYSTAEVREHELVRFNYGEWRGVKMMHHIFCYQPSPAKKQFSKDSDQSNHSGGESSPIAPRTPSVVDIQHNGKTYTIQVQVLGAEETWQTPSLLLANVKDGNGGKAIFSQVHLEVDPTQYQDDERIYAALRDSNTARLQILKNILSSHLDMDCTNPNNEVKYTVGYLLGRHDMKLQMLRENSDIVDNRLVGDKLTLIFCGKDDDPGNPTYSRLPVMILSCPALFSTVQYFETLETEEIGRLVVYSDVMTTSQDVLSHKLVNGLVVIPRQQTQGLGRSSNIWLSPIGCAMFSLQLHIPMKSTLGRSLTLVQHIVMASIVSAIKNLPGHQNLEIGLKWPNDLYAYSRIKIGGLIVNSQVFKNVAVVNIGCGVNLDNSNPTLSLNDIIGKYNEDNGTTLSAIAYEKYFALVFNELERILKIIDQGDMQYFYDLYYKHWLHSNTEISVTTKDCQSRKVKIIGIDDFGYLTVRSPDGTVSAVQPDGNTFDMLKGLIAPKIE